MRREIGFALLALLAASFAAAQQAAPPTPPVANDQPVTLTAYYAGPGVSAPELIPITLNDLFTGHCKKLDGTAVLSAIIDAKGTPHDVFFIQPIGNDLDKLALAVVETDRFKPGSHDGSPAAVVISAKVKLSGCIEQENNETGQKSFMLRLRSVPDQAFDLQQPPFKDATLTLSDRPSQPSGKLAQPLNRVSAAIAPAVIKRVEAHYSDAARREKITGTCLISLIVDAHGMPQNQRVAYSLEPSLDQNAMYAISQYRFKPAMLNGIPVPVMITVEVDFKLY